MTSLRERSARPESTKPKGAQENFVRFLLTFPSCNRNILRRCIAHPISWAKGKDRPKQLTTFKGRFHKGGISIWQRRRRPRRRLPKRKSTNRNGGAAASLIFCSKWPPQAVLRGGHFAAHDTSHWCPKVRASVALTWAGYRGADLQIGCSARFPTRAHFRSPIITSVDLEVHATAGQETGATGLVLIR